MDRMKEIEERIESEFYVCDDENVNLFRQGQEDIEYLLAENKRLRESLAQIKYEYEQGTDDKVSYRMYMESVQALREDN